MSNKIILIALALFTSACNNNKDERIQSIKDYFETEYKYSISDSIQHIVVLTSQNCQNCNISFSNFLVSELQNINFDNTLLYVNVENVRLDNSPYLANHQKNLIVNNNPLRKINKELNESKYISWHDNRIDTVITIDAKNIQQQVDYIADKILIN